MVALVLAFLYPEARPLVDYTVQDDSDGRGAYVAQWNKALGPQPTPDDLVGAEVSQAFQEYLTTREKAQIVAKVSTPELLAVARLALKAAGAPVPDDETLKQQLADEVKG